MIQILYGILLVFWGLLLMFNGFLDTKYEKRFLSFREDSGLYFESKKEKIFFIAPKD